MRKRKSQIMAKLAELEARYDEFADENGYGYERRVVYTSSRMIPIVLCTTLVAMFIFTVISIVRQDLEIVLITAITAPIGVMLGIAAWTHHSNKRERKLLLSGQAADIVICFYTQAVLDEICEQIARIEQIIERKRQEAAERNAKQEATKMRNTDEVAKVKPRFEVLLNIVCTELSGKVVNHWNSDDGMVRVELMLPTMRNYPNLEFATQIFEFSEKDLNRLTFIVAQLRPLMAQYHSLKESLDAAVLPEQ